MATRFRLCRLRGRVAFHLLFCVRRDEVENFFRRSSNGDEIRFDFSSFRFCHRHRFNAAVDARRCGQNIVKKSQQNLGRTGVWNVSRSALHSVFRQVRAAVYSAAFLILRVGCPLIQESESNSDQNLSRQVLNDEDKAVLIIKATHYTLLSCPSCEKSDVHLIARYSTALHF